MLHRLPYTGLLPASFAALGAAPYLDRPYAPADEPPAAQLCALLAASHDIVFYTDHRTLQLAGLFPKEAAGGLAYFGFWETTDDLALNQLAFDQLRAEARERGFRQVQGPLHFSTYFRYRLRLGAAPSWGQFDREPVNPPYYPQLLAAAGFRPALTFESRRLRAETVPAVYRQQAAALSRLDTLPFDFIPLNSKVWQAMEEEIFALIQQVFGQNPAYRAVSRAQFGLLYNAAYAAGLCPHSSVLFRHRASGRLAALSLCQPNYQPLALPPGTAPNFIRDYPRLPAPRTLLAKTVGVHPDFRGQGLQALLAAYAMRSFLAHYEDVIFCLMRADNLSLRFTDGLPAEVVNYALFEREA
jgi:ribosomal protein S18 acetylase RimI-like enzyme